ncbi:hypothetical protein PVAND_008140 [Polypedilum vanderplanki]|uniref:EF-hand domain-containing protein n=1 Tax=Polypedilum vanderplanki TaxID=319348 RepID=A0A9J6CA24_POLVA|nr:hypothetical protein PVAND_008140 [Polypedilum vanderplanki]
MGNEISSSLIAKNSKFTPEELERLSKKFKKLDLDKSGSISSEEFMSVPEMKSNPLAQRIITLFDSNGDGEVDFREFIATLSLFSVKSNKEEKLKFAFRIYDVDNDGLISYKDLVNALKMMVGKNLTDYQINQICARTMTFSDVDDDAGGKISFEAFSKVIEDMNIHNKMILEF